MQSWINSNFPGALPVVMTTAARIMNTVAMTTTTHMYTTITAMKIQKRIPWKLNRQLRSHRHTQKHKRRQTKRESTITLLLLPLLLPRHSSLLLLPCLILQHLPPHHAHHCHLALNWQLPCTQQPLPRYFWISMKCHQMNVTNNLLFFPLPSINMST